MRVNFIHCVYRHRLIIKDAQNSLLFKMVIVCVCMLYIQLFAVFKLQLKQSSTDLSPGP